MENNNQEIKLCPVCGAKNNAAYKYCNECGAALSETNYSGSNGSERPPVYNNVQGGQNYGYNPSQNYANNNGTQYNGQFGEGGYTPYSPFDATANAPYSGEPDFSGVSAKDLYEFTGEKADLFYKLKIQHFSGRTGPFCWPLLILGLLLNFFGIGCWYLYHKMYKPAIGFFSVAFVDLFLKCISIFAIFQSISIEQIKAIIESPDNTANILTNYMNNPNMLLISLLDTATSALELAALVLAIVLPFFAYKQYKNFAIAKIYNEYSKSPLPNIAKAGGTKGGLVALVSVAYVVIFMFSFVASIVPFVGKVITVMQEDYQSQSPDIYNEMPFEDMPFDFEDKFPFE
jgi:hypothetical protein